jgi:hypothetical protein
LSTTPSLRHAVTAKLKTAAAALPAAKRWRVETGKPVPANIRYPYIKVTLKAWEPHPAAPRLYWTSELAASLFLPNLNPEDAADAFEEYGELLTELVTELKYPGLVWTRTELVTYDDRPALDVVFTITNGKVET